MRCATVSVFLFLALACSHGEVLEESASAVPRTLNQVINPDGTLGAPFSQQLPASAPVVDPLPLGAPIPVGYPVGLPIPAVPLPTLLPTPIPAVPLPTLLPTPIPAVPLPILLPTPLEPVIVCDVVIGVNVLPTSLTTLACPKALQAVSVLLSGTDFEGYGADPFMSCNFVGPVLNVTIAGVTSDIAAQIADYVHTNIEFVITVGTFPCDSTVTVTSCNGPPRLSVCSPLCPSLCCKDAAPVVPTGPVTLSLTVDAPVFFDTSSCPVAIRAFQVFLAPLWSTYMDSVKCSYQFNQLVLTVQQCSYEDALQIAKLLDLNFGNFFIAAGFPCGSTVTWQAGASQSVVYGCPGVQAMCCPAAPPPPPGVLPAVCPVSVKVTAPQPFNPNVPPCPGLISSLKTVLGSQWVKYAGSITCSWVGNKATVTVISSGKDANSIAQTIVTFLNFFNQGAGVPCGSSVSVETCGTPVQPPFVCSPGFPSLCCPPPAPQACPYTFTVTNPASNNFTSVSCPLLISTFQNYMNGSLVAYWTNIACSYFNNTMSLTVSDLPPDQSTKLSNTISSFMNNIVVTARIPCGSVIATSNTCNNPGPAQFTCGPNAQASAYPSLCCPAPVPAPPAGCPVTITATTPRAQYTAAGCVAAINATKNILLQSGYQALVTPKPLFDPVVCSYSGNKLQVTIQYIDPAQAAGISQVFVGSANAWVLGSLIPCGSTVRVATCTNGTDLTCNNGFGNVPALCCPPARCGLFMTVNSPTGWSPDSCAIAIRATQLVLDGDWGYYLDKVQCSYNGYTLALSVTPMSDQDAWTLKQLIGSIMNAYAANAGFPCGSVVTVNTCNQVQTCSGCPKVISTPATYQCGPNLNNLCCNARQNPCATYVTISQPKAAVGTACTLAVQSLTYIMKSGFIRFINNVQCTINGTDINLVVTNMPYDNAANLATLVTSAIDAFIIGASVPCNSVLKVYSCQSSVRTFTAKTNPSLACPPSPPPPFQPRGCPLWVKVTTTNPFFGPLSCPKAISALKAIIVNPWKADDKLVVCSYDDKSLLLTVDSLLPTDASDLQQAVALAMNNFVVAAGFPCDAQVHLETCDECNDCHGWHPSPKQDFTCSPSVPALCCPPCPATFTMIAPAGSAPFIPGINWCFFATQAVLQQLIYIPELTSMNRNLTCSFNSSQLVVTVPGLDDWRSAIASVTMINNANTIITNAGWNSPNFCGSTAAVQNCKSAPTVLTCSPAVPSLCCGPINWAPPSPPPPSPPAAFNVIVNITSPAGFNSASCQSAVSALSVLTGKQGLTCSFSGNTMIVTIPAVTDVLATMTLIMTPATLQTWIASAFGTQPICSVYTSSLAPNTHVHAAVGGDPQFPFLSCVVIPAPPPPLPRASCTLTMTVNSPSPFTPSSCALAVASVQRVLSDPIYGYLTGITCSYQTRNLVVTIPNIISYDAVTAQALLLQSVNNIDTDANFPCGSTITFASACPFGPASPPVTASCDPRTYPALCCNTPSGGFPVSITIVAPTPFSPLISPCPDAIAALTAILGGSNSWPNGVPSVSCSYQGNTLTLTVNTATANDAAIVALVFSIQVQVFVQTPIIPCGSIITVASPSTVTQTYKCSSSQRYMCCGANGGCVLSVKITLRAGSTAWNSYSCPAAITSISQILDGPYLQYQNNITCSYQGSQLVLAVPGMDNPTALDASYAISHYIYDFISIGAIPCGALIQVGTCLGQYSSFTASCDPTTTPIILPAFPQVPPSCGQPPCDITPFPVPIFPYSSCNRSPMGSPYGLSILNNTVLPDGTSYVCFNVDVGVCAIPESPCCQSALYKFELQIAPSCPSSCVSYQTINGRQYAPSVFSTPYPGIRFSNINQFPASAAGTTLCMALRGPCNTLDTLCPNGSCQYAFFDNPTSGSNYGCCPSSYLHL